MCGMQNLINKIYLGNKPFIFSDVWLSCASTPVQKIETGASAGKTFLSFWLTKEQREFLGNSAATHIRIEVEEVE